MPNTSDAATEILRISGLGWAEIGDLFEEDPRTVPRWASGAPPMETERLLRAYEIISRADQGSREATLAFLSDTSQGLSLRDLITSQDWDQAEVRVAGRQPRPRPEEPQLQPLTPEQRRIRYPITVAERMEQLDVSLQTGSMGPGRPVPYRRVGSTKPPRGS